VTTVARLWPDGYLRKHPQLSDFVSASNCVLLQLEVESFYVVSQFHNITVLQMT
jgi:hypothetical protein